jgi:hypothetical protein
MGGGLGRCRLEGGRGRIRRGLGEGNRPVIGGGCVWLLLARVLMLNLWGLMLMILTRMSVRRLGCIARAVILATRVLHSRDLNERAGR